MNQEIPDSPHLYSQHGRFVAKIALSVSAVSFIILLIALAFITNDAGESYGDIIYSHALTRQQLKPAMLIAALVLVIITGFVTWLIALYTSFRFAGPLYRFTQHFKLATVNPSAMEIIPLRESDALQNHAKAVKEALSGLHDHYAAMKDAAHDASSALTAGDAARYNKAVAHLRQLDEKARI